MKINIKRNAVIELENESEVNDFSNLLELAGLHLRNCAPEKNSVLTKTKSVKYYDNLISEYFSKIN